MKAKSNGNVAWFPSPDKDPAEGLYNIACTNSGLAIVSYVPLDGLAAAVTALTAMNWWKLQQTQIDDTHYFGLVKEVIAMADRGTSKAQEAKLAKDLGGKVQPASGARWGNRRDVITPSLLVEAKSTDAKVYRVRLEDMAFLKKQARQEGRCPVYCIDLPGQPTVALFDFADIGSSEPADEVILTVRAAGAKAVSIKSHMAEAVNRSNKPWIRFETDDGPMVLVGYDTLLEIAKSGIND